MRRVRRVGPLLAALWLAAGCAAAQTLHPAPEPACAAPPASAPIYDGVTQRRAATADGPIAYYRFGHGSPILLVTGYRAMLAEWDAAFLSGLAAHHELILFDNRGIGGSLPDARNFSVQAMAGDVASLIRALDLHRPTVLGWSMGGVVAQQLALQAPEEIGRLVLLSTLAPGGAGMPVPARALAVLSGAPGTGFNDVMAVLFPARDVAAAEHCFVADMYRPADYVFPDISAPVTAGQAVLLQAWAADDTQAARLRTLRIPTLILTGDQDDVVAARNAEALARLLPDAKLVTIAGGGHAMMYQYPAALAALIESFVPP